MMLTRLAVGLEPLNALDAAHRSPRSLPHSRTEVGSPAGPVTRQPIKRNKELVKLLTWFKRRQMPRSASKVRATWLLPSVTKSATVQARSVFRSPLFLGS